ncbi:MAG: glycosyltransferase family 2 protein [Herpetosiphonaceae bacterium]|nr:glycosyltransferase family 2 protein [Herpetosiphonaceae bacterium]
MLIQDSEPLVSVVIPVYNEAESLRPLMTGLHATLETLHQPYEIIAVDDGSRDDSFALLRELAAHSPQLRVVRLRRNFGQTQAFAAGFDRARGEIIVTIDADLQNDPTDIPRLLHKLDEGYDVVSGWRANRHDAWLSRRLPSVLANRLISAVTGLQLHDYGCSLKAYRREVVQNLALYGELHRFIPAIASWQGIAVTELPVTHHARRFGSSKYGLGRTLRVLLDLVTVRFLLSYATRPMQFFGLIGLGLMGFGTVILAYLAGVKFVLHQTIGDRPLLLVGVMVIVLGMQFLSIGLIGEMLVRTTNSGREPAYRVREEVNSPATMAKQPTAL